MRDLIVSVPDHSLSFYFTEMFITFAPTKSMLLSVVLM